METELNATICIKTPHTELNVMNSYGLLLYASECTRIHSGSRYKNDELIMSIVQRLYRTLTHVPFRSVNEIDLNANMTTKSPCTHTHQSCHWTLWTEKLLPFTIFFLLGQHFYFPSFCTLARCCHHWILLIYALFRLLLLAGYFGAHTSG